MFIIVILYFISISNVACELENDNFDIKIQRLERENGLFDSINSLINNIKTFFGLKSKALEDKKKRIKNAFHSFFDELNKEASEPVQPGFDQDEMNHHWVRPGVWGGPTRSNTSASRRTYDIKPDQSAEHMITSHGYKAESHTVLTADGYMLTMQRVMPNVEKVNNQVVMIHHGLLGSAEDWLLLGPDRALPYLLTDNGFDVWLLNARGNVYSKIHTSKNTERQDYWDFSFHEMGVYDLPAGIKYVREITKNAPIHYIGHSMGATALLVLLSTLPEYNYVLTSGILLAPLAFMYHAKGPIKLLADFHSRNGQDSLNFLGQTEFIPHGSFPRQIIEKFCKADETSCYNPLLLLANGGRELVSKKHLEAILTHVPAGGSAKTIIHYVQLVRSGYFQMFDYGSENNSRKYGNNTPPLYDLSQVTLPLSVFSSPSDWLSTITDVHTLIPLLQDVTVHSIVKAEDFGHLDFVWSQDAPEAVFSFILGIMEKILANNDSFFQD